MLKFYFHAHSDPKNKGWRPLRNRSLHRDDDSDSVMAGPLRLGDNRRIIVMIMLRMIFIAPVAFAIYASGRGSVASTSAV